MMGVTDEGDDISYARQMSNVFCYDLVQRVRIGRGVSDKALVVVGMVSAKLHFRVEREVISVLFQWLHVVTECVVGTIRLRQDIGEKTITHADAK